MNKTKDIKNTRRTSLRMQESLALKVEALASEDSRSFNQMINILLEKAVSQRNKELSNAAEPRA